MRRLTVVLSTLVLAGGLAAGPGLAGASPTQGSAVSASKCGLDLGSVNMNGDHVLQRINASSSPTVGPKRTTPNMYVTGAVRMSSYWTSFETPTGRSRAGAVIHGGALYSHSYGVTPDGALDPSEPAGWTRIGGGWEHYTYFESSAFWYNLTAVRSNPYGLRNDGTLFRWSVGEAGYWTRTGSATGFAAVKGMALISKTATYDTFLANTRDGALYTIRIPLTSPMKPVFTKVRSATWQRFETIVAGRCLDDSTVFVAIDKDTQTGHAYVMTHAQGTATTIYGMGQVPATFADTAYFRWAAESWDDPLFGA